LSQPLENDRAPGAGHPVAFEPAGACGQAATGRTIMEIAAELSVAIRSDCGGRGRCGQCRVLAYPAENLAPPTGRETELLPARQIERGWRLACEAVINGPLQVTVPDDGIESREANGKGEMGGSFSCHPMVARTVLPAGVPERIEGAAARDLSGLIRQKAGKRFGAADCLEDPEVIRMLGRLPSHRGDITLVRHAVKGVTAVLPGRRTRSLGIALDIGTTTLAAYLCDLGSGQVLGAAACANPQRRFGEDVISRISFADQQDAGLAKLQNAVGDKINVLIDACVQRAGALRADIDEASVVGNTTMLTIFMGVSPHSLGVSPYRPVSCGPHDFRAKDLGLNLNPAVNVHIFPILSGFVGGDTAGVILSQRPHEKEEITLIVDIGTNGELVLGNRSGLWATSCATGPALEGAHIHCGMRASAGAICRVFIDRSDFGVRWETVGGKPARGICGSGVIDAAAAMFAAGLILPNGRIREGLPGVIADERGIGRKFILVPAQASGAPDIYISLEDVRQVQLAKSALAVGIRFLMRNAGVDRFDRLVLTGAFGARFDWKNAVAIGMLPEMTYDAEVEIVEDAAGQGAVMALLDGRLRKEIARAAAKVRIVDLAQEPDFAEKFAEGTLFRAV